MVAEPEDRAVPTVAAESRIEWTGLLGASAVMDRTAQLPPSRSAPDQVERLGAFRKSRRAQAPNGASHRAQTTQPRRDTESMAGLAATNAVSVPN